MLPKSYTLLCTISKTISALAPAIYPSSTRISGSSTGRKFPNYPLSAMNNTQPAQFYSSDETTGNGVKVLHDPNLEKFFVKFGADEAFLQYEKQKRGRVISLVHTEVPAQLEGRGLGKILAKEAFAYIAQNNLKAEIECEFVWHYLEKYGPEFKKYVINKQ